MKLPPNPVIYEVYPRSFCDTTGSGEGDISGIISKLPYIAKLGVDAVWCAPLYPSPFVDGGYDVSDYTGIAARFGTLDDVDRLIASAHDAGLALLLDIVMNHTSDAHPWFDDSVHRRNGREHSYHWRDAKPDGSEPNNWRSLFGGTGWTWSAAREQYYFHLYHDSQPSLNLRCPHVQNGLRDVLQFWRARGVDGFRLDAVTSFLSDPEYRDNPIARPEVVERSEGARHNTYSYQDHVYDLLPGDGAAFAERIRAWAPDAYMLGEVASGNQSIELARSFTETGRLDSAYTKDLMADVLTFDGVCDVLERAGDSSAIAWGLACHDVPRFMTRLARDDASLARFYAMLLAAMPGAMMIYQGDELGLTQADLEKSDIGDPYDLAFFPKHPGRDGARVPMPWQHDAPHFGFTTGTPWLPLHHAPGRAADLQERNPASMLSFYRDLLRLRRTDIARRGTFSWSVVGDQRLQFERCLNDGALTTIVDFRGAEPENPPNHVAAPDLASCTGRSSGGGSPPTAAIWHRKPRQPEAGERVEITDNDQSVLT